MSESDLVELEAEARYVRVRDETACSRRCAAWRARAESAWRRISGFVAQYPLQTRVKFAVTVAVLLLVFVGVFVAIKLGAALAFLKWVDSIGNWGPFVMVLALIVASLPLPLFGLFTVASGFLFKLWKGLAVTMLGCALGSLLVFLGSRFIFREKVEESIQTNPFFLRFNGKIEKEGWKLAIVMRLASAPFGFVNMFLAVTKMPLYIFFLTTMVGELPIAFIGCFVGATMQSLSEAAGTGGGIHWTTQRIVLFAIEGTIAVVFFVVAILLSRKMVKDSMEEPEESSSLLVEGSMDEDGSYALEPVEAIRIDDFDTERDSLRRTPPPSSPIRQSPLRKSPAMGQEKMRLRRSRSPETPN